MVVIHYTAMVSAEAAITRLSDPAAEVSAHYVICRTGAVTQLVSEEHRAWHAGQGEWRGLGDINSRSIGIELDNDGAQPFPEPQMDALQELLRDILGRWPISPDDVIGHSDMAPGRKWDPGPRFDWARLARNGLAGPTHAPAAQAGFRETAQAVGFTADVDDATLLLATRLRFAPWRRGPEAAADRHLHYRA